MSSHARHGSAHGASRKRKERANGSHDDDAAAAPAAGNRLLAGYMAYEFLTKGTLLGRRWDPARSDPADKPDHPRPDPTAGEPGPKKESGPESAYLPVAYLLKADGAHVPGVVNPTQLARWLQM